MTYLGVGGSVFLCGFMQLIQLGLAELLDLLAGTRCLLTYLQRLFGSLPAHKPTQQQRKFLTGPLDLRNTSNNLKELRWRNATTSELIFVIESLLQWLHLCSVMVTSSTFFEILKILNSSKILKNSKKCMTKLRNPFWKKSKKVDEILMEPFFKNYKKVDDRPTYRTYVYMRLAVA